MVEQIIEKELNVKEEVLDIAAAKIHFHPNYVTNNQLNDYITQESAEQTFIQKGTIDQQYAPQSHISEGATPVNEKSSHVKITNATTPIDDTNLTITQQAILNYINTKLNDYIENSEFDNLLKGSTFSNPIILEESLNEAMNKSAGFYKFNSDNTTAIIIEPDTIYYNNGILEIKEINNQKIYHLYATSLQGSEYKLNGKEFVKYGDENWRVYKIPQKVRPDLIKNSGPNVDINSFKIYENTAGYIFEWHQGNERFTLPVEQNNYTKIYNYETLPITGEYIFGNLIGHCDIKITNNQMSIRSINQKDEVIEGVNINFFVPRNN